MTPEPVAVLAEVLAGMAYVGSDPTHSCYPGHHGTEYATEILVALLALPPDRRAALAAALLDVETLSVALGMCPKPMCLRRDHESHLRTASAILAALRSPQ